MTLEQLGIPPLEQLEKMTDQEIEAYFGKYLDICRVAEKMLQDSKPKKSTTTKPKRKVSLMTKEQLLSKLMELAKQ